MPNSPTSPTSSLWLLSCKKWSQLWRRRNRLESKNSVSRYLQINSINNKLKNNQPGFFSSILYKNIKLFSTFTYQVSGLVQRRMALVEKLQHTSEKLMGLQQRILDQELTRWKRDQQMAGNGRPFNESKLTQIQDWWENLPYLPEYQVLNFNLTVLFYSPFWIEWNL